MTAQCGHRRCLILDRVSVALGLAALLSFCLAVGAHVWWIVSAVLVAAYVVTHRWPHPRNEHDDVMAVADATREDHAGVPASGELGKLIELAPFREGTLS